MKKFKSIGKLDDKKLKFIYEKRPDLAFEIKDTDILMWDDRIEHIEKHRMNFRNIYDFDDYIEMIPDIIENPDYIGIKNKNENKSIQFIKQYDDNILIAVRLTAKGKLSFRTMYPITDGQLADYIKKQTAWKYK